jgi:uncharacterized membrane protein YphA (DoxX/SURF4 family)
VKRWIERWDAYWFPRTTTQNLALSRIVVAAAQLLLFPPVLEKHINYLTKNSEFIDPQLIISGIAAVVPRELLFTPSAFTSLYWVMFVAGLFTLVGFFTRPSAFVFALLNWVFIAHEYSYGDRHHGEALFLILLMCYAFSPSGDSYSVDALLRRWWARRAGAAAESPKVVDTAMWPLKFIHVLLAMTYFSTGMSKLIAGGPAWMNGYTLQLYTFNDALNRGKPFGLWLAQQHNLAIGLSIFTILFETFFFLSVLFPWTMPLFFIGGIFFHLSLYMAGGHDFFQHILLLFVLLLFLAPTWWRAWLNKYAGLLAARWRGQEQAQQAVS